MIAQLFLIAFWFASAAPPPPKTVDITAPDGAVLKATYYAADRPAIDAVAARPLGQPTQPVRRVR